MVVLPFVPVTAAISSSWEGSPKNSTAAAGIASRAAPDEHLRHGDVDLPFRDERGGARCDRLAGQVMAVDLAPGTQKNSAPGVTARES